MSSLADTILASPLGKDLTQPEGEARRTDAGWNILHTLGAGDLVGELSFMHDEARYASLLAAGTMSTGVPFNAALPDTASTRRSSATSLKLAPGLMCASPNCVPGRSCPQPCGRLATPGIIESLAWTSI